LRRDAVPDQATANRNAGDAQAIGNLIYAGRNGNGDAATGDGCRFRGGGLTQLTGRTNYQAHAAAIGMAIEAVPACPESAGGAALSGCWYFGTIGRLPLADAKHFREAFGMPVPTA